jgi:lysophospholipase L1-like esterase
LAAAGLLLVVLAPARAADPDFSKWEPAIAAFEKQDAEKPPPKNAVVFAGSSSIRLWDIKKSFPDLPAVNRGFGGSTIPDCTHFAARTVLKHEPRLVVFYAGDNDLAAGHSPERVADDFKAFVRTVHEKLPKTRVAFIAIKPSPARLKLADQQRRANALIEEFCKSDERLTYVDVVPPMLTAGGKPRPELFRADGLHLNDKGYELWAGIVRPVLK